MKQGRLSKCANNKNERAIFLATKGPATFGRVNKMLGNRQFSISIYDYDHKEVKEIIAIPRGIFSAGGKSRVQISTGDFVLLDGLHPRLPAEIMARLDKKSAQTFFDEGRIDKAIYNPSVIDELFDYSETLEDIDIDAV